MFWMWNLKYSEGSLSPRYKVFFVGYRRDFLGKINWRSNANHEQPEVLLVTEKASKLVIASEIEAA